MKLRSIFISAILLSVIAIPSSAQREAEVHSKSIFSVTEDDNITLKEAKHKSIVLARAEAIKAEFGELVTSDVIDSNSETDGNQNNSFYWENTIAMAKGEWLGDTRPPVVQIEYKEGRLEFTAEVWGHAREIAQATTDIKWEVMRHNGVKLEKTTHFGSGDRMYINFQTPADGYLALYLIQDDQSTSCLLPYTGDNDGRYSVMAGKSYRFFDRQADSAAKHIVMKTNKKQEHNMIVLIYSPNPFTKCVDNTGSRYQLNSLNTREFQTWLLNCLRADRDMVVKKTWVEIHNSNAEIQ